MGGWAAIQPPRECNGAELLPATFTNFPSSPAGSTRRPGTWLIPGHSESCTHLALGATARSTEDVEPVPGQVPGAPKPLGSWPQAARFLHGAAPAQLGRGPPHGCPGGPAPCPLREGAQRAFVPGGHHPLAGPSPLAGKPLPAGPQPTRQQFSVLLTPSSEPRTAPRSLLPTAQRSASQRSAGVPPTDAPPPDCPDLAGALFRG